MLSTDPEHKLVDENGKQTMSTFPSDVWVYFNSNKSSTIFAIKRII